MRLFLLLAALLGACVRADARPTIFVGVEHGDAATALATGYDEYVTAATLGLDRSDRVHAWRRAARGQRADIVMRHADDDLDVHIAEVARGHDVYVQPAAAPNGLVLVRNMAHGMVHAVYPRAQHVCRTSAELPDAMHPGEHCSPVGVGPALSNPRADYGDDDARVGCYPEDTWTGQPTGGCSRWAMPVAELTDLDRAEIARAGSAR